MVKLSDAQKEVLRALRSIDEYVVEGEAGNYKLRNHPCGKAVYPSTLQYLLKHGLVAELDATEYAHVREEYRSKIIILEKDAERCIEYELFSTLVHTANELNNIQNLTQSRHWTTTPEGEEAVRNDAHDTGA